MDEMQLNQQVAEKICEARQVNGRQFQLVACVALLDGQVVAVAGDLDAALWVLLRTGPKP